MRLHDLFLAGDGAPRPPTIHPERCVWSRLADPSCVRCVDSCPRAAWRVDDESLGIDPDRCDGCGLCVAACPQGALTGDLTPLRLTSGETPAVFAHCEFSAARPAGGRVPCVHALGLAELAGLYGSGVRRLVVCVGDCAQCPRGPGEQLGGRIARLNQVLDARGLAQLVLESVDADQWQALLAQADPPARSAISRRAFLRGATASGTEGAPSGPVEPDWQPPGRVLAACGGKPAALFAPRIDARRCTGCDACLRVCPHAVLGLSAAADAFTIAADGCTGCGLCADVCDQHALEIAECVGGHDPRLALYPGRCRVCGADFHHPAPAVAAAQLCHVCARNPHRRNLFQAL